MLIATAGHIDHGKTTLVRALTGVDTDRLPEEKIRGISIELGYAYAPLPNGAVLGIVDVPGHERFVRTMIAGACGVDFALLLVAADDGIMPQTREHLEILDLLGIRCGAVALTKLDRASDARVAEVRSQIMGALAPTTLAGAPIFTVNATAPGDTGTERLRRFLHESAMLEPTSIAEALCQKLFRLAVDRVFTLAGHGTIVTGTVLAGQVKVGDTVTLMPAAHPVRVRNIHSQDRAAASGRAGQRCALNLAGIQTQAISRGDWIADPRALLPTMRIDTRVRLLSCAAPLQSWSPVHYHSGTTHALAHAVPLDVERASALAVARVQLVFAEPVCVVPGDRFILRDAQAARTIGGGVVLDPAGQERKRRSSERLRYLDALEQMISGGGVAPLLECATSGLAMVDLVRLCSTSAERLALPSSAIIIDAEHQRFILHRAAWEELRTRALSTLRKFHDEAPDELGVDIGRLRRMVVPGVPLRVWRAVIDELVAARALVRNGAWLHLPEHVVAVSASEQGLLDRVQPLILAGRFDPPWVRDLAAAIHEPEERIRSVLRKQVQTGAVHQVVHDLFYGARCISELAEVAARLAHEHGAVEAAPFRDAVGVGRKRAIQILEFFDRIGYTRRVQDRHLVREDSGWAAPVAPSTLRRAHVPGGASGLQTQEGAPGAPW